VATVVAKLFNLAQADAAYFGQKDAQQVVVIRRMARDLNFPLEIVVCPTIRETDGLALSSRNAYLNQEQRRAAAALYRALRAAALAYEAGERDPEALRAIARAVLAAEPLAAVAYVSVADPVTLEECATLDEKAALMSLAARVGQPRLIDNCLLPFALNVRDGLTATLGAQ
jgi:pantoate--beta-alanine ligase